MLNLFTTAASNITHKIIILVGISLLSSIPLGIVMNMTSDRQYLYNDVVNEIGQSWGPQQRISGPALVIPYRYHMVHEKINDAGELVKYKSEYQSELVILPKKLKLNMDLKHDFRSRGIYQSLVYNAAVSGKAKFVMTELDIPNLIELKTDNARLIFGISANQAIEKIERLTLLNSDGKVLLTQAEAGVMPGTGLDRQLGLERGFHQPLSINLQQDDFEVDFAIALRGSQSISALPLGEHTDIAITTDWPHPSFNGILPTNREISDTGFSADWKISHLTRNYPQVFSSHQDINLTEVQASSQLFEPVTHYGKIERSVKYGMLFIALTFIVLLIFEFGQNTRLNLVQYLLVGCAVTLFYLLLLSLSEHLEFNYAYTIAASIPVLSVSAYVASATASYKKGAIIATMLTSLYGVLYSILKLEDYALLMGTGLLLTVLLILMFITRHKSMET
ncbi:cell envelope integrity protein CreD [Shewanella woodyi]|uniref:Inner membrane CreD family protein n=1 Tax=Shewanella woodyi (strain ATCC 51908 / MS32) TaxID=392500 RepID=B1KQA6_SHEWM|nr:cell envelope integrity protein CreD [Shewanella woodyi]ACA84761.1 Inner membrane CreD family protein [Shewanella woodyi ATCC 51908]